MGVGTFICPVQQERQGKNVAQIAFFCSVSSKFDEGLMMSIPLDKLSKFMRRVIYIQVISF
jgi:hypothetical protein